MGTKVRYEWDRESVDGHGDVKDHDHRDRLVDFHGPISDDQRLVLVRDVFCEFDGLIDRCWAYVNEDGTLPDRFDDGSHKVPARFRAELARYLRQ